MAVRTGRYVQCEACGRHFHVFLPDANDAHPLPTTCACGGADWKAFDANSAPCGTPYEPIRIPVVQENGFDGWLPPLRLLMPDGRVRDSASDRLDADLLRRLGMSDEDVVEKMGYSPRPLIQGE